MIDVKDITKSYGDIHAVKGISFSIKTGECYGLLGPNGAGKSTTINMLSTLFPPDEGGITLDGKDTKKNTREVKQILGIVPQEIALYENLSAWENLLFWGSLYGISRDALSTKANELLKLVGLEDRKNEKIKGYSGGMKRRINVACSLLHSPKILLLDEPTVGVDPQSRNLIFELIQQLNKTGMTIIYTTHYMEEAEKLCDRIGIIDNGKIVAQGTFEELRKLSGLDDIILVECTQNPDKEKLTDKLKAQVVVDGNKVEVLANDARKDLTRYIVAFADLGYEITRIDIQKANLEGVFLKMTGKKLRD